METCPSTNQYAFALSTTQVTPATSADEAGGLRYWWKLLDSTKDHTDVFKSVIFSVGRKIGLMLHIYARDTSTNTWKHIVSNTAYMITGTATLDTVKDDRTAIFRAPLTFNVANGHRAFIQYLYM